MNTLKSPWDWTPQEVNEFLKRINLGSAEKYFESHGINGSDLLEITENDLRSEFGFLRIHDRKMLLRSINDLKKSCAVTIELIYNSQTLEFRIDDINKYNFETLLFDSCSLLKLNKEKLVIKDSKGLVMGSGPVQCIFKDNKQIEKIYLGDIVTFDSDSYGDVDEDCAYAD
ncbi:hypothetical protein SteCoe_4131 [Stentor coeruleus]|uniref:SAM domain-containing protein n=1 Tax=Stentor coeruleus TaxID=5963 RepID=A0A1R2CVN8_9CILI|nr:hypothetical protein SteCoe_4131 [Stentor coeruleus]